MPARLLARACSLATLLAVALAVSVGLSGCFHTTVPPHAKRRLHIPRTVVYQVRPGDTLYGIARRHGLDYHDLARRNRIRPPYTIYVGQRLYIHGKAPKPSYLPLPRHRASHRHATPHHVKRKASRGGKTTRHRARHSAHHGKAAARHGVVRLIWPANGPTTSGFGRRHGRPHDGIDIGAPEGSPVRAAASGEVVYSSHRLTGYGNLIIIRHTRDMFTAYAHNRVNLVRRGDHVKQGQVIARVGHTGRASGPHLHFEVRRGPTPVNPLYYLPRRKRR